MAQYYTVDEANAALRQIEPLVVELAAASHRIVALRPEIEGVLSKANQESGSAAASQMVLAFVKYEKLIQRINRMGVEVKDPATGLCDFLALHEGREIYLCWRLGEPRVEWWHDLHTGFAGRRHVAELTGSA